MVFLPEMHGLLGIQDCVLLFVNMAPLSEHQQTSPSPTVKRSTSQNGIGQKKKTQYKILRDN